VSQQRPEEEDRAHTTERPAIGDPGERFEWIVEAGKVAEFGTACLDPHASDPRHVPITFTEVATHFWEQAESRIGVGELDRSRLLHGEQELEYVRPLQVGDRLTGQTKLVDRYVKAGRRGGEMTFLVYETTFVDEAGAVVVRSTKTLLEVSAAPHE
jgi:hypothetical protein